MIRLISPLPYVDEHKELHDGIFYKVNTFCYTCQTRDCADEYKKNRQFEILECKKGLHYFLCEDAAHEKAVVCGFLIKGKKFPKDHDLMNKTDLAFRDTYLAQIVASLQPSGRFNVAVSETLKQGQSRASHDMKHLFNALQRIVENKEVEIAQSSQSGDKNSFEILSRTIQDVYSILGAIKAQFDLSDYLVNPDSMDFIGSEEINIFGLFEKYSHLYNVLAKRSGKSIQFEYPDQFITSTRDIHKSFLLLPSILLQNAVKFSDRNTTIYCGLQEKRRKIAISIESYGQPIPRELGNKIFDLGVTYTPDASPSRAGTGFGLYVAREVARRNGFHISFTSRDSATRTDGTSVWTKFVLCEEGFS